MYNERDIEMLENQKKQIQSDNAETDNIEEMKQIMEKNNISNSIQNFGD